MRPQVAVCVMVRPPAAGHTTVHELSRTFSDTRLMLPGWRTFFEEPAMLLGVVLVGRALEERAKLQASADMAALQVGLEARLMHVQLCTDKALERNYRVAQLLASLGTLQRSAGRLERWTAHQLNLPCLLAWHRAYCHPRRACCWATAAGGRCLQSRLQRGTC